MEKQPVRHNHDCREPFYYNRQVSVQQNGGRKPAIVRQDYNLQTKHQLLHTLLPGPDKKQSAMRRHARMPRLYPADDLQYRQRSVASR